MEDEYFQIRFSFFKIKKEKGRFRVYRADSSFPHNYPNRFKKTGFLRDTENEAQEICKTLA